MSATYSIYTSPSHPPVADHLPTLIVTPFGKPSHILYSYLHTNFNREQYLLTPSEHGDLCVAKLYPPNPSTSALNGKAGGSSSGHGHNDRHAVRCEASRNLRWTIRNEGIQHPVYKLTLPTPDNAHSEQPLFQVSKPNPNSPWWTLFYFTYAGHMIPPKRIEFGRIMKNQPSDGQKGSGGGTKISVTGKTDQEKAVWKTLGEGNEDMVEWIIVCAALNVLDDEITKAAEAAGVMSYSRPPPSVRPPPGLAGQVRQLHPTGNAAMLPQPQVTRDRPAVYTPRGPPGPLGQMGMPPPGGPPGSQLFGRPPPQRQGRTPEANGVPYHQGGPPPNGYDPRGVHPIQTQQQRPTQPGFQGQGPQQPHGYPNGALPVSAPPHQYARSPSSPAPCGPQHSTPLDQYAGSPLSPSPGGPQHSAPPASNQHQQSPFGQAMSRLSADSESELAYARGPSPEPAPNRGLRNMASSPSLRQPRPQVPQQPMPPRRMPSPDVASDRVRSPAPPQPIVFVDSTGGGRPAPPPGSRAPAGYMPSSGRLRPQMTPDSAGQLAVGVGIPLNQGHHQPPPASPGRQPIQAPYQAPHYSRLRKAR